MIFLLDYVTWTHIRKPWKILESKRMEEQQVNKIGYQCGSTQCYTHHLCLRLQKDNRDSYCALSRLLVSLLILKCNPGNASV
jgi:hypothetical protein